MSRQGDGGLYITIVIISLTPGELVTALLWTLQVAGIWRIIKGLQGK